MKSNIAAIACASWVSIILGMTIGLIGQQGEAYVVGWDNVLAMADVMLPTAVSAFLAGRSKG